MLENQFIQFYGTVNEAKTKKAVPLVIDSLHPLQIFIAPPTGKEIESVEIVTMSNQFIDGEQTQQSWDDVQCVRLFAQDGLMPQADTLLNEGDQIMIRCECSVQGVQSSFIFSNPIVVLKENYGFSELGYKCNEDALGFPFVSADDYESATENRVVISLPIRLHSPQNEQEDKTYVKANGEVVTLFAKYYKEWEGETEYLSEEMHDKIVAALSCDEVYIDGKRVTKSDKYQVDWENYDIDCDGVTKLARATFKVRENTNQRNSNF